MHTMLQKSASNSVLVQFRPRRNPVVHHQKIQSFFSVFLMNRRNQHPAGINAHHLTGRQIYNSDCRLPNQFFRLVILVNSA